MAGNVEQPQTPASRDRVLHLALHPSEARAIIDSKHGALHYWTRWGLEDTLGFDSWEEWGEWRTEQDLEETDDYAHLVFRLTTGDEQEESRRLIDEIDPVLDAHWGGAAITDEAVWSDHQSSVYCDQDFMAGSICARLYGHDSDHDERP